MPGASSYCFLESQQCSDPYERWSFEKSFPSRFLASEGPCFVPFAFRSNRYVYFALSRLPVTGTLKFKVARQLKRPKAVLATLTGWYASTTRMFKQNRKLRKQIADRISRDESCLVRFFCKHRIRSSGRQPFSGQA